mgnify:CR=1 FL=1
MNLTEEQKKLLCDLIDGYAYPRFLCQCDPSIDTEGVWDKTKEGNKRNCTSKSNLSLAKKREKQRERKEEEESPVTVQSQARCECEVR